MHTIWNSTKLEEYVVYRISKEIGSKKCQIKKKR